MTDPAHGGWRRATPQGVRTWLAATEAAWWVAGGWAIDLHLGRQTRPHADFDIGCFREDLPVLRRGLEGWEFHAAAAGSSRLLLPGELPPAEANSLWCRPHGADAWWLQLLLDERDETDWVFRRCRRVRWPVATLALRDSKGTPYLRPEVQLLYKAKAPRARDEDDFSALLPELGAEQRAWLSRALETWDPGHAWVQRISRAG